MTRAEERKAAARARLLVLVALLVGWTVLASVAGASMVQRSFRASLDLQAHVLDSLLPKASKASAALRGGAWQREDFAGLADFSVTPWSVITSGGARSEEQRRKLAWIGLAERSSLSSGSGCVVFNSYEFDETIDLNTYCSGFTRCPPCFVFNGSTYPNWRTHPFKLTLRKCSTMKVTNDAALGSGRFRNASQNLDFVNLAGSPVVVYDGHVNYHVPPRASASAVCSSFSEDYMSVSGSFEVAKNWARRLSAAGAVWQQDYPMTPPSARSGHQLVETTAGRLWAIGGKDADGPLGDMHYSDDGGQQWTGHTCNMASNCFFGSRYNHAIVQLADGTLLFIGGRSTSCAVAPAVTGDCGDVWSSHDGWNWTQEATYMGVGYRDRYHATAFGLNAYIIGGANMNGTATYSDAYEGTYRGSSWSWRTTDAAFGKRARHAVAARSDGTLLVAGGVNETGGILNDVWASTDQGVNWFELTSSAAWAPRYDLSAVVRGDGHVLIMAGTIGYVGSNMMTTGFRDVWHSADGGTTWGKLTGSAFIYGMSDVGVVARRDGSMLVLGGEEHFNYDRRLSSKDELASKDERRLQSYYSSLLFVSGKSDEW